MMTDSIVGISAFFILTVTITFSIRLSHSCHQNILMTGITFLSSKHLTSFVTIVMQEIICETKLSDDVISSFNYIITFS